MVVSGLGGCGWVGWVVVGGLNWVVVGGLNWVVVGGLGGIKQDLNTHQQSPPPK